MEVISQKRKLGQAGPAPKAAQLQVEAVLGLAAPAAGAISCCPGRHDLLCYPAGSFVVIYNITTGQQQQLLHHNGSCSAIACVAWSVDGQYVIAGTAGSNPPIQVWDVGSSTCVHNLKGHKATTASLRFSADGNLLLSAGTAHDGQLCIWDWHAGHLLWKQSVGSELCSAAFTEDSSHVLAVGKGMFKAWSISLPTHQHNRPKGSSGAISTDLAAVARPVTLKELRSSNFVDVCVGPCQPGQPPGDNGVYALVDTGILVLMRPTGRTIDKSVNLQVQSAFALAATAQQLAVACAQGVVRLFSSKSLTFRTTLPRFAAPSAGAGGGAVYPDAQSCSFSLASTEQLVVAYADHTLIVWDVTDTKQVHCMRSLPSHGSCIWDVCALGNVPLDWADPGQQVRQQPPRVATCAADGAVRLWNLSAVQGASPQAGVIMVPGDRGPASSKLRCMCVSPDCRHICVGDQHGNIRVYDSVTCKQLSVQEAHDGEVLCLDYSPVRPDGGFLAASGSRDMLIHIYNAQLGYQLLETLDDHSAAVTAVRFTGGGKGLVSCGADRSIIFRVLGGSSDGTSAAYHIETLPHSLLYDLALDPLDQYVLTTGQDGVLRFWDVATGALKRSLQPASGAGRPVKLCIDPGGVVVVACCSDGSLLMYQLATGQLMCRTQGHADMAAAAAFTPDLTKVVSVGGDGCMVVWRLPEQLVQEIQAAVVRVGAAKRQWASANKEHNQSAQPAQQPGAARAHKAWADSTGAPAAVIATAHTDWSTPQHQPSSESGTLSAIKTTLSSDGGMGSPLHNLRQGKPLVSTDKLPKWARPPSAGAIDTALASSGSSSNGPVPKQQQHRFSRWFAGKQAKGKWQANREPSAPVIEASKASHTVEAVWITPESPAAGGSMQKAGDFHGTQQQGANHQQQQQWLAWPQEDDAVVIQDWEEPSMVAYDAHSPADIEHTAVETEPDALQPEQDSNDSNDSNTHQPGAAEADVVRDLFKQHFSSLELEQQYMQHLAAGDSLPRQQQQRRSLSAVFKLERQSIGDIMPLRSHVQGGGSSILGTATALSKAEHSCAAASSSATAAAVARLAAAAAADPTAASSSVAEGDVGTGTEQASANAGSGDGRHKHQDLPSPKRRWRHGQMDAELAGMRERLANLQALYQQQLLQRQLSPRRNRTTVDVDQQQQQQPPVAKEKAPAESGSVNFQQPANQTEPLESPWQATADNTSAATNRSASHSQLSVRSLSGTATSFRSSSECTEPGSSGRMSLTASTEPGTSRQLSCETSTNAASSQQPPYTSSKRMTRELPVGPLVSALACETTVRCDAADAHVAAAAPPLPPGPMPKAALASRQDGQQASGTAQSVAVLPGVDLTTSQEVLSSMPASGDATSSAISPGGTRSPSTPDITSATAAADAQHNLLLQLLQCDSPQSTSPMVASPQQISSSAAMAESPASPRLAVVGTSPPRHGNNRSLQLREVLHDSVYRVSIGASIAAAAAAAGDTIHAAGSPPGRPVGNAQVSCPGVSQPDLQSAINTNSSEQQQHQAPADVAPESGNFPAASDGTAAQLPAGCTQQPGVTVNPQGPHTLWCGWGTGNSWEASPASTAATPTLQPGTNPWPANGPAAVGDAESVEGGAIASSQNTPALTPEASDIFVGQASEVGVADVQLEAGNADGSKYAAGPAAATPPTFWINQNPCYDMTPLHSTPNSAVNSRKGMVPWPMPGTVTGNTGSASDCSTVWQTPDGSQPAASAGPCHAPDSNAEQPVQSQQPSQQQHGFRLLEAAAQAGRESLAPPASVSGKAGGDTEPDTEPLSPPASLQEARQFRQEQEAQCETPGSSSKAKNKAEAKREKAAVKAAAKAAAQDSSTGNTGEVGAGSSPSSTMLSLLQRMKRTLPGMKAGSLGSSGGGTNTAPAAGLSRTSSGKSPCLAPSTAAGHKQTSAAVHGQPQQTMQQQAQQRQANLQQQLPPQQQPRPSASTGHSQVEGTADLGDVCIELQQAASSGANMAPGVQQQAAAELAARVNRFKQSVQDMQQLWGELDSLQLGPDAVSELQQLLAQQHSQAAAVAAAGQHVQPTEQLATVCQCLQAELLGSIGQLHATLTAGRGLTSGHQPQQGYQHQYASPGWADNNIVIPAQLYAQSSQPQQQQQYWHLKYATAQGAGSSGLAAADFGLQPSGSPAWSIMTARQSEASLEELTSRICEQYTGMLLKKLYEQKQQKHAAGHTPVGQ